MLTNSLAFDRNARFITFDTETSGLGLTNDKPYQLSWLLCSPTEILETHNHFILWENFKMSEEAAKITKFDYGNYMEKAEPPIQVYQKFAKYLYDKSIMPVCQNLLNFDCYMIKNLQKSLGIPVDFSYLERSIDTKVLFIAKQKEMKYDGGIPFLNWQYKLGGIHNRSLKSSQIFMLDHFEIPYEKERLHEALYDITMLFEIFKKILHCCEIPNLCLEKGV